MKAHIKALGLLILILSLISILIYWVYILLTSPVKAIVMFLVTVGLMIIATWYVHILDWVKERENLKKKDLES